MFNKDDYAKLRTLWATYKGEGYEFDILISREGWSKDVLEELGDVLNHAIMTGLKVSYSLVDLQSAVEVAKISGASN